MGLTKAPAAPQTEFVKVSTLRVDPKVLRAALTPLALLLAAYAVRGLTHWHLLSGLTGSANKTLASVLGTLILTALVFLVGYFTKHGEPIIGKAEAEAKVVLGPEAFTVIRSEVAALVRAELYRVLPANLQALLPGLLPGLLPAPVAPAPVTVVNQAAPTAEVIAAALDLAGITSA